MPEWLGKFLNLASFGTYPFMYAGFCRRCDFVFQGIAWTRRGGHRRADSIARAHDAMHAHTHHPADEEYSE